MPWRGREMVTGRERLLAVKRMKLLDFSLEGEAPRGKEKGRR